VSRLLQSLRVTWLFTLIVLLAGCNTDFVIDTPSTSQRFDDSYPESVRIYYRNKAPQHIMLNGVNVAEYFTIGNGIAIASGQSLDGFLKQGANILSVEPNLLGPRRTFFVDTEGPKVVVTKVMDDKTVKRVIGEAIDPAGVAAVSVNGISAALDSRGRFNVAVPPESNYRFIAQDQAGRQSVTDYADRATVVSEGLSVRIAESGVNDMLPIMQKIIADVDFNEVLSSAGATRLFDENVGISLPKVVLVPELCVPEVCLPVIGCTPEICTPEVSAGPIDINLLSLRADLTNLDIDALNVAKFDFTSGNRPLGGHWEGVAMDASVHGADFGVHISLDVLGLSRVASDILDFLGLSEELDALDGDFGIDLGLPRLRFAADLGLSANDGDVHASIEDIDAIGLGDFNSDFTFNIQIPDWLNDFGLGLPAAVVNVIMQGLQGAKDLLVEVLLGNVVPIIANVFIDTLIDQIKVNAAVAFNNGAQLSALFVLKELDIVDQDTAMTLTLSTRVGAERSSQNASSVTPSLGLGSPQVVWLDDHFMPDLKAIPANLRAAPGVAADALGFRFTDVPLPVPADHASELNTTLSQNLMNQAFLAIHESGLLNGLVEIDINGVVRRQPGEGALGRVLSRSTAPMEIQFRGRETVIPHLLLNHFQMVLQTPDQSGRWQERLIVDISAEVPLALDIVEGNLRAALLAPDVLVNLLVVNGATQWPVFNNSRLLQKVITVLLTEQINMGLASIKLPLSTRLAYEDEVLNVIPSDVYNAGTRHFGFSSNFARE